MQTTTTLKERKVLKALTSLLYCLLVYVVPMFSQHPVYDDEARDILWPKVKEKLQEADAEFEFSTIFEMAREHCKNDQECLLYSYTVLKEYIELEANLVFALYICEELLDNDSIKANPRYRARIYSDLYRYYAALDSEEKAARCLDSSIVLYEKAASPERLTVMKMRKIQLGWRYKPREEVVAEMDSLLAEVITEGYDDAIYYMHHRIANYKIMINKEEEALEHIKAIENMPIPDSSQLNKIRYLATAKLDRMTIADRNKDYNEVLKIAQKALYFTKLSPNPWIESKTLDAMGFSSWELGNKELAYTYIDSAQAVAERHKVDDQLASILRSRIYFAETEGQYKDALDLQRQATRIDNQIKSRSENFDLKNYYLEIEKNQLATEKENRELELKISNIQLRSFVFIALLALSLAIALAFGFMNLRRQRKELSAQNILISQQAEKLANLDKSKSRFFANISHELRTPLTLVLGPLKRLVNENQLSNKQRRLLHMARKNGQQLQELINDILDL
ncbi:MAG: histidine kinase dimerization/phospho-acceptor domain-containing protein, partial [Bacteroidota bacterium]